jgi:hypothetical protein
MPCTRTCEFFKLGVHPEPTNLPGTPVADRISRGSSFWEEISDPHRDRVVLEWIRNGYKLEWSNKGCAPTKVSMNHPSATNERDFVNGQV